MNPVCYFEIGCQDLPGTKDFYSHVFGWKIDEQNHVHPDGPHTIGGHFNALGHEPHQYVLFYLEVDDVEAHNIAKSIANEIEETMQYPGQIRVTVIRETRCVEYAH